MEEDIQERKRLQRLRIPVPKYDAFSSGEVTPDPGSVPSDSYVEAWHSRSKKGALKPKEPVEEGDKEEKEDNGVKENNEEKEDNGQKERTEERRSGDWKEGRQWGEGRRSGEGGW